VAPNHLTITNISILVVPNISPRECLFRLYSTHYLPRHPFPLSLHSTPLLYPHARHRSQPGRSTCRSICAATAETSEQQLPKHLRSICAASVEASVQQLPKHLRSTCRNICAASVEAPAQHLPKHLRSTCRSICAATAETSAQHLPKHLRSICRSTCRSICAATAETSAQQLPKHLRSNCRSICAATAEAPAQPMLDGDSLPVRYGVHGQREGIVLYQHLEELLRGVFAIGAFEKME